MAIFLMLYFLRRYSTRIASIIDIAKTPVAMHNPHSMMPGGRTKESHFYFPAISASPNLSALPAEIKCAEVVCVSTLGTQKCTL